MWKLPAISSWMNPYVHLFLLGICRKFFRHRMVEIDSTWWKSTLSRRRWRAAEQILSICLLVMHMVT
ncbi:hypothetical protein Nepgr_020658 [Nepenthes gracilis]|uniref:Uncharacterized protein n=1 Tax=Nepenthes gracilis TaxID=150966 RepID=A0AAD3SXD3_NEPGR|nr:hypothetical protein Nepgr_020658 [Nepenthes gracilis]